MSVAERERERQSSERDRTSSTRRHDTITNKMSYPRPITAVLRGRPVKILAQGDLAGASPVIQFVNEDGRLDWEEEGQFTIIDSEYLPTSRETVQEVLQSLR